MRSLLLSLIIVVSACSAILSNSDAPFRGDAIELPPTNAAATALDNRDVELGDVASGGWLGEQDLVVGYITPNDQPIAYPHKILNAHEIVNDQFDGVPVLISYCPLCGSGVVYDRRPDDLRHDTALTFSNTSALYGNDLVMVDAQDGNGNALPTRTAMWFSVVAAFPEVELAS